MPYTKSIFRIDFDKRIDFLINESRKADKLKSHPDVRDMVFQCAVFQTSAAIETYLRLLIEGWAQNIRVKARGMDLPTTTRGYLAGVMLMKHFDKYTYSKEEAALNLAIATAHISWPVLTPAPNLPPHFDGKSLHDKTAYPSLKNIKRLFNRTGVDQVQGKLSSILKSDVETLIDGFQSVRTAIAHSSPPSITIKDVKKLLRDMKKLVQAIDKMFYRHVSQHGGIICWS